MGEVFAGRYELIDPIGRGGVGAVWRAWDQRRKRYVAAKVLQQSDAHTLLRFVREQALRIDHPHVLAPASWAADDDKVLFTMDLVAGGSLAHVIGDYGALPPRFVCTLLDQLLSGLAAVHAEGVVHRDIKPANILMEATGTGRPHLRLSDFGISMRKGEPRLTETNFVVGTPGYFAPEQLWGAEPDFPSDLFAVGLVALFLLQGQKPDADALVEYFQAHGTPGAPEGVPEPLWQVLAGLLQPDPDARFRTATGARKALASAVELLPEDGAEEEPVEVFDQLGPLPPGYGPEGPAPLPSPSETGSFHLAPPPGRPAEPPYAVEAQAPGGEQRPAAAEPPAGVPHATDVPRTAGPTADALSQAPLSALPPHATQHTHGYPQPDPAPQAHGTPPHPAVPQAPTPHQAPPAPQPHPAPQGFGASPAHGTPPTSGAPVDASTAAGHPHRPPHGAAPAAAPQVHAAGGPPLPTQPYAQHPQQHTPFLPYAQPQPHLPPHSSAEAGQAPFPGRAEPPAASRTPPTLPLPSQVTATAPVGRAAASEPVTPARRPGPPRAVAVPVLLLALACLAVGFWALLRG
ncbi:serine/threonine protein kinase [Streptomyces sp. CC53]|uniref:serine/threonine-protein kinase n=1 Tax=unclassified Streptomyces TaxID=2593676 RepID=UPI0008DC666B|nr:MULTISPECIES: serine/threonine-protein kinase [unclassified Streptomyces]OII60756.1 serine/threonine protein kinase [Streptomyces sp. CC53]